MGNKLHVDEPSKATTLATVVEDSVEDGHVLTMVQTRAVGGDVYPINKVALVAPWIALAAVIIAGGIFLIRRRVHI